MQGPNGRPYDFTIIPYAANLVFDFLGPAPIICLLAVDNDLDAAEIAKLGKALITKGASYFVITGRRARDVEDIIDHIAEDLKRFEVVTATVENDDLSSILLFLRYASIGDTACQYLAIIEPGPYGDLITAELLLKPPEIRPEIPDKATLHGQLTMTMWERFPTKERFGLWDMMHVFGSTRNALLHAQLFCPEFIEIDGSILLRNSVSSFGKTKEESFLSGKMAGKLSLAELEASFNSVEVGYLFAHSADSDEDGDLLAEIIAETWRARLNYLYPHRKFEVSVLSPEQTSHITQIEFFEIR